MLVATCDNPEDIKFVLRQKEKKSDIPKTNKKKLSGTKNNSVLYIDKSKFKKKKDKFFNMLITDLVDHKINYIGINIFLNI